MLTCSTYDSADPCPSTLHPLPPPHPGLLRQEKQKNNQQVYISRWGPSHLPGSDSFCEGEGRGGEWQRKGQRDALRKRNRFRLEEYCSRTRISAQQHWQATRIIKIQENYKNVRKSQNERINFIFCLVLDSFFYLLPNRAFSPSFIKHKFSVH